MKGPVGAIAAMVLSGAAAYAGGWGVVTVEDVPNYAVAGRPTTFTFSVRAHGRALARAGAVQVTGHSGDLVASGRVVQDTRDGYSTATIAFPKAGPWTVTVDVFGGYATTQFPLEIVNQDAAAVPMTVTARGRQLFAAKGCASCHVKSEWKFHHQRSHEVGPALSGRTFEPETLRRQLLNPARTRGAWMPNLGLSAEDAASLVAFLNATSSNVTARAQRD